MGSTAKFIIADEQRKQRTRRGCYLPGIILIVLGVLAFRYVLIPFFETGGGNADTREVPGDPTHFDPIASFQAIKAYAGAGAQLTAFDAYFVRSDGTLDLTASYYAYVDANFVIPTSAPPDAPPIGAGGTADGDWFLPVHIRLYQPGQWRRVSGGSLSYTYLNRGMQRDTDDPTSAQPLILPDPTCAFADLWAEALRQDAPPSAVAIIEYSPFGYSFRISDTGIALMFSADCELIES